MAPRMDPVLGEVGSLPEGQNACGMLIPASDSRPPRLPTKSRGAVPSQLQLSPTWEHLQPFVPSPSLAVNPQASKPPTQYWEGSPAHPASLFVAWGKGGRGALQGGLERGPEARGARVGGRAVGEPLLVYDGPSFPELSPLITESG